MNLSEIEVWTFFLDIRIQHQEIKSIQIDKRIQSN